MCEVLSVSTNKCAFCGTPCDDNFCSVQCKLEFIGSDNDAPPMYLNEPYEDYIEATNYSEDYEP